MATYLTAQQKLLLSKAPESAYNTPYIVSTDFIGMTAEARPPVIPSKEKIDDLDEIGRGAEFASNLDIDYLAHSEYALAGALNTEWAAKLLARALGGTITDTLITAATSWDHDIIMQTEAQGLQLPSSSLVVSVGPADNLFTGMVVDSFTMSFQGGGARSLRYAANLVGSGKYLDVSDIASPVFGSFPSPPTRHTMHGAATVFTYNNGSTITASARLRSFSVTINNNLIRNDRRPGDPFFTSGDVSSGAFVARLERSNRTAGANIVVLLDDTNTEIPAVNANTALTAITFKAVGGKIGASPESYEVEMKIPVGRFRSATVQDDNGRVALSIDVFAMFDPTSAGAVVARVRNGTANLTS